MAITKERTALAKCRQNRRTGDETGRTADLLEWVTDHALPGGALAEQVDPYSGAPLSVSPLTWSHAAFVESISCYLDALTAIHHRDGRQPASDGAQVDPKTMPVATTPLTTG